ncbi:MAG: HAD family phosphatase [Candidatus Latescibacteria bacterium]|nr:HAD family phosphatase [Candidatus Latescibacterota bacterium]
MGGPYDLVVFDVGGVLVQLTGMSQLIEWTGLSPDELRERWLGMEAVRAFESGFLTYEQFAPQVIAELRIPRSVEDFRLEMAGWMRSPFPEAEELVRAVGRRHTVACLCNMNPVQWQAVRDQLGIGALFENQFVSYELGMVKPDLPIYQHVAERMGVPSERVVFFDDSRPNIEGAQRAGWSAYLVRGTQELKQRLVLLGLL